MRGVGKAELVADGLLREQGQSEKGEGKARVSCDEGQYSK